MKPAMASRQKITSVVFAFLFTFGLAGSAGAWGNAPTHVSMAQDLTGALPDGVDEELFLCAAVAADLGKTRLFQATNRGYVHSMEFAQSLLKVAGTNSTWRATALAWAVHMKVDDYGHLNCIPPEDPAHAIWELHVDVIFYHERRPGDPDWEAVNDGLGPECCDPKLIFLASQHYRQHYDAAVPLVWPHLVMLGLKNLKATIAAEYDYHRKFGNARVSQWWLDRHDLDGWPDCYRASVNEAQGWLNSQ